MRAQGKARHSETSHPRAHLEFVQHVVDIAQGLRACGPQGCRGGALWDAQQLRRRVGERPLASGPALRRRLEARLQPVSCQSHSPVFNLTIASWISVDSPGVLCVNPVSGEAVRTDVGPLR